MSNTNESQTNVTAEQQYQGLLGLLFFSTVSTVPCCVFLFINVTLLFTLRSKPVFRETSRYVFLFNLLFADTVLLAHSQLLYLLAVCRIRMTYPVCGVFALFASLTTVISPLTLVVMSLERYVAVCYPLRHATIMTIRNTGVAIVLVWAVSSLNVLIQAILLLNFPFEDLQSLQMKDFCDKDSMLLGPMSDLYDKAFTGFLFVSAGVAITCSYIGVMVAARSASTNSASARKALNTLLLHLVQLGLSLSSTVHNPLLIAISKVLDRIIIVRIQTVLYMCIIILPRCLSALIYGIRDQNIRPILVYHLCCHWKCSPLRSVVTARAKISIFTTS
ncbi:odorant receptor 131-2-like [Xiphias gladius]|uniref:odorant receptor 131-2-like n=1 Tax=Xiphias gladius TaxID=8245 RepID=UPI001A99D4A0|nr:odorant receptor 131-2-like [Xiphias gladius]